MAEYPLQSYYPASKVRLNIRFDEFGDIAKIKQIDAKTPRLPPQLIRGQKGYKAPLKVIIDPANPNRFLLVPKTGAAPTTNTGPQKQDKSSDLLTHLIGGVIPKSATLSRNGIRTADTLTLTIRYLDLPIDPRTVRSCGIEFYLGTMTEDQFKRGIDGSTVSPTSNPVPINLLPDTYVDEYNQTRSNLRFLGFVDTWEVTFDKDSEPVVILECRDNTTLLIDQLAPPNLRLSPKLPIDQAIAQYMANFPRFNGLSIEYRPGGVAIPTLGGALAKTAYRPDIGPPPNNDHTVFDYFTDLIGSLGHTCRVVGTTLIIQRIVTQTSSNFVGATRQDDPYKPRKYENGKTMNVRNFIYGRNILSMKIKRQYTVNSLQCVEVRSYSPKRKKVLVARFPKIGDTVYNTTVRPGDIADQKWTVYRLGQMVEDEKTLRIIAQSIYESVNRSEMTVNVKTRNLSSFGGGNLDPDILDLEATDTIEIFVNREEEQFNSITQIETIMLLQARAAQYLTALGYSQDFAAAYAKSYSNIGFQTRFRVRAVTVSWDIDNGVELDIMSVNYIEIRGEKFKLPPGEQITQKQTANQPNQKASSKPLLAVNPG